MKISWVKDGMNFVGTSADGAKWRANYRCTDTDGKVNYWLWRNLETVYYFAPGLPSKVESVIGQGGKRFASEEVAVCEGCHDPLPPYTFPSSRADVSLCKKCNRKVESAALASEVR